MPEFVHVRASGDHRQIGRAIGKGSAAVIRGLVAVNAAFYRRKIRRNLPALLEYAAKNYLPFVRRRFPGFMAELEGIAEGAGLTFDDILPFSIEEELLDRFAIEKCSTAAVRTAAGLILGHNEDFGLRYRGRLVMVEVRPNGRPAFLSLSYPGTLAGSSCGLNAAGIAIANDSLNFIAERGIPKNFIFRAALEARTLAEVAKALRIGPRAIGLGVTAVSAGEDDALAIETSPSQTAILPMGTAMRLAHTNHVLSSKIDRGAEKVTRSSRVRLAGLGRFLPNVAPTEKDLERCLSSKKNWLLRGQTLATVIMRPAELEMRVLNRAARPAVWKTYRLGI